METPLAWFYAEHAAPWAMVFLRVLGLFIFAPLLSGVSVPFQFRGLLAAMLALAVYSGLSPADRAPPPATVFDLGAMAASELLIGSCIGIIATLPMVAVEAAGQIMGYQLGFGLAQSANPDLDINIDAIGMMLFIVTVGIFISIGGLEVLLDAMLSTFGRLPPGGLAIDRVPLDTYVALLGDAADLSLRLAGPIIGVVLVSLVALGVTGRLLPQLNLTNNGFTAKIMVGVGMFTLSLFASGDAVAQFIAHALESASDWALAVAQASAASPGGPADG